jgi:hypothetical protein
MLRNVGTEIKALPPLRGARTLDLAAGLLIFLPNGNLHKTRQLNDEFGK